MLQAMLTKQQLHNNMKKITTIFAFLIAVATMTFGQSKLPLDTISKKVVFWQVIELDTTYKADQIFSIVKEWFSTNTKNFNHSNSDKNFSTGDALIGIQRGNSAPIDQLYKNDQPLKLQDPVDKKLIGKGVLKYTGTSMGCIRVVYIEYDIKVFVKDYKLKVEITNLNYTHYNQMSMKQSQIYGWSDDGPCSSKNTIENLLTCERCSGEFEKFYSYITTDMDKITTDLKKYLIDNKKAGLGDGW